MGDDDPDDGHLRKDVNWLQERLKDSSGFNEFKKKQNRVLQDAEIPSYWEFAADTVSAYWCKSPSCITVGFPLLQSFSIE